MKRPSVARANARIRMLVQYVHDRVDTEHAKPTKQDPRIQCAEGCTSAPRGCCSLITVVEIAEAEYLVDRQPEAVERALPALLEAERRISERISADDVMSMFGDKGAEADVARVYHELGVTCPFLGEDRRCTVYRDRPLACRTHFVLSPPVECEALGSNQSHIILDKGTRIGAQAWLVQNLLRARGGRLAFGTLPQLVLAAWRARR